MKQALSILLVVTLLLPSGAAAGTEYGAGVAAGQPSSVSDIFARPDAYVGKTVTVRGTVVDVCAHRGCWMDLAGARAGETIRVKVEDGVIDFPVSARGRVATVQGVVERMKPCPEEGSAAGREGVLAIRATGAVIE